MRNMEKPICFIPYIVPSYSLKKRPGRFSMTQAVSIFGQKQGYSVQGRKKGKFQICENKSFTFVIMYCTTLGILYSITTFRGGSYLYYNVE